VITQKYMIMFIIYVQYIINCLRKISTMIWIEYQYLSLNTSTSTWKRYLSTAQVPVQVPGTVWNDMPADTVDFISSSSSSSFYLPDNTTVCTSTSIQFRRAGQQGPTRTLTAALNLLLIFRNPLCVLILLHTWSVCPEAKQARGGGGQNGLNKDILWLANTDVSTGIIKFAECATSSLSKQTIVVSGRHLI